MRKSILTTLFTYAITVASFAQVGIGTTTPNASSVLDLTSTSKAFLPPRMTSAQRDAIVNPVAGMVIFNTTTTCVEIYRGTGWFNVCTGTSTTTLPAIDGYTSSNQVASNNLIAYWPFDANTSESTSNTAPYPTGGSTITSGGTATIITSSKIGSGALQLNNGFLTYPLGATRVGIANNPYSSTDTLTNGFTISLWAQLPLQSNYNGIFQLSAVSNENTWPLAGFGFHKSAGGSGSGLIDIDGGITNSDGTSPYTHSSQQYAFSNETTGGGQGVVSDSLSWVFLTMTYDTTGGGKLVYYGNGAFIGSVSVAVGAGNSSIFPAKEALLLQTPNYATIGSITSTTAFPNIGTGIFAAPTWSSPTLTGVIDDLRFFDITLTAQQVSDLFQLGNQGR